MALLIRGGQVLAGTPAALTRADVMVDGDRIAAVGPDLAAPEGTPVVDASGHIVLPGMANAHTHAGSHLVRGRAGSWTLEDLLTHSAANYAIQHAGGRVPLGRHRRHRDAQDRLHLRL